MNILVTGANGQLGNEIRRRSEASVHNYIFTDVAELDITNASAVLCATEEIKPEVIINCAAYTNVDKAEDDEQTAHLINCTAVENLAAAAKQTGALLVHVSTDYVFDGTSRTPYRESDTVAPINHYGEGKLRGEQAIVESGCRGVIVRTQWLYAPEGKNFVKTMLRLAEQQREVRVVADQYGCPTAADDLAAAIVQILPEVIADRTMRGEIFHYASVGEATWCEFAEEIFRAAECDCRAVDISTDEYPTAARRPRYSVLDCSKIHDRFGVVLPDWRASLKRNIERIKQPKYL